MIAQVALAADALTDACGLRGRRFEELHRNLAELLMAHGELVFADSEGEACFHDKLRELERLSPNAQKYWEGVLQYGRLAYAAKPAPSRVERLSDLSALVHEWAGRVDVALMEPGRAAAMGCPNGEAAFVDSGSDLEVGCHDCAGATRTLGGKRRLDGDRSIQASTDRDSLWNERFAPLARTSAQIHLLDSYLGRNLDAYYRECDRRGQASRCEHEAEWLISRIARDAVDSSLTIYTSSPDDWDAQVVPSAFQRAITRVSQPAVSRIELIAIPERLWKPHDRHFRGDDAGIELSAGFDRLRTQTTRETFTATYMWGTNVKKLKDEAMSVRRHCAGSPAVLLET